MPAVAVRGRRRNIEVAKVPAPEVVARGRRRKIVVETTPEIMVEAAPEIVASPEPVQAAPKTRGRKKKEDAPVEQLQLEAVQAEPVQSEPVQLEPVTAEPIKAKTRGRPKRSLETEVAVTPEVSQTPVAEVAPVAETSSPLPTPKARGRKPKVVEVVEPELAPEPEGKLNPETLEVVAPVAEKKLVRVRREAKEDLFSHQGALYNPYESLLEFFRANPAGLPSREVAAELDETLLNRLGGRKGLEDAISLLERHKFLTMPKRGFFQSSRELIPVVGRLEVRADGSGWLTSETPGLRPMLIPSGSLLFAWHGDRVVARELRRSSVGQSEGEIIRILERSRQNITGTLEFQRGYAVLRPDETLLPPLSLETKGANNLSAGMRLVAEVLYPEDTGEDEALARVQNVLGEAASLESERIAVMTRFGLPNSFSSEAVKAALKLGSITAKDLKGRIDLRGKPVYALSNLETALQIEPLGNGNILLGVHYADAAHWIEENDPLETAALERGASVQLSGETLPLFPAKLLAAMQFQPNSERLALSVLIETNATGNLVNYVIRPSVVGISGTLEQVSEASQALIAQIGGIEAIETLAVRLAATAIAASDVTALYRETGQSNPELPSALERSSGFDPQSITVKTLQQRLGATQRLKAIHSSAATEGLSLRQPLSRAADFLNLRILAWCATKLSQRKREMLEQGLPALATQLERLENRAKTAEQNFIQFQLIGALHKTYPVRGVVIGITEFALELVLENGAIGKLSLEDLGEEITYTTNQWKTRLGRVFKPGSIVRVMVENTRPATREAQLVLHQKESPMSRLRRRKTGANAGSGTSVAKPSVGKTIARRGVVVLGNRPRTEYPRPVRITARKLYFGEWSRERFTQIEGDNPEFDLGTRPPRHNNQRPAPKGNAEVRAKPNGQSNGQPARATQQINPRVQNNPNRNPNTAKPDTSRHSRIEALRQKQMQALERNANRSQAAPAPVSVISAEPVNETQSNQAKAPAYRSRRRPNRGKAPAA